MSRKEAALADFLSRRKHGLPIDIPWLVEWQQKCPRHKDYIAALALGAFTGDDSKSKASSSPPGHTHRVGSAITAAVVGLLVTASVSYFSYDLWLLIVAFCLASGLTFAALIWLELWLPKLCFFMACSLLLKSGVTLTYDPPDLEGLTISNAVEPAVRIVEILAAIVFFIMGLIVYFKRR